MASLVDTHCHLNFDVYNEDREEVLIHAREHGIKRIVIPGIDLTTSQSAVEMAKTHPGLVFAAVGVHPNEGSDWNERSLENISLLIMHPWVVAIGEIGLDFYRDHTPRAEQIMIFKSQLDLARERNLPVIIHNRNSMDQIIPILTEWYNQMVKNPTGLEACPGIMHSFDGSVSEAMKLIGMNFMIGVSGPVTFKNAAAKQEVVAKIPIDHILTETDAPYLTPQPFRGRRNEPKNISYILEKIAQLHNLSLPVAAEQIESNAAQVFKWGNLD